MGYDDVCAAECDTLQKQYFSKTLVVQKKLMMMVGQWILLCSLSKGKTDAKQKGKTDM